MDFTPRAPRVAAAGTGVMVRFPAQRLLQSALIGSSVLVAPSPLPELPSLDRAAARDATAWARSAALEAMVEGGQHAATWLGVPLEVRPARAALRGPADVATESPTVT